MFGNPTVWLWDIAAGTLLVREAGGFVSDFSSKDTILQNGNIVAANAGLHISLLKMLREGGQGHS